MSQPEENGVHNNFGRDKNPPNLQKIRLANVKATKALAYDPASPTHKKKDPKTWDVIKAEDFDLEKHGHMKFYCLCCYQENKDLVRLKAPNKDPFDMLVPAHKVDERSGKVMLGENNKPLIEYRRYKVPKRFSLYPNQQHNCSLAYEQARLSSVTKHIRGVADTHNGNYILPLNIPTNDEWQVFQPFSDRKGSAEHDFNGAGASDKPKPTRKRHASHSSVQERTGGVQSVEDLAQVIDACGAKKHLREQVLLREGSGVVPLSDLYHDNNTDMYRKLSGQKPRPGTLYTQGHLDEVAAFPFKPSRNKKLWGKGQGRDRAYVVPSQREKMTDEHGRTVCVRTFLRFETQRSYMAFEALMEEAEKNGIKPAFLIYSRHAVLDPGAYKKKFNALQNKPNKPANVRIDASIRHEGQFMPWNPPSPQLSLLDKKYRSNETLSAPDSPNNSGEEPGL